MPHDISGLGLWRIFTFGFKASGVAQRSRRYRSRAAFRSMPIARLKAIASQIAL